MGLVAIIIAAFAYFHNGSSFKFGATGTGPGCGGSVTCLSGDFYASGTITANVLSVLTNLVTSGSLYLGGATSATGVQLVGSRQALVGATTTPCAIVLSATATTTLTTAQITESVSSTTASLLTLAVSSNPTATTTFLSVSDAIAANAQYSMALPATTTETGIDKYLVPPGYYVVFGQSGGTGTFSPTGFCSATGVVAS